MFYRLTWRRFGLRHRLVTVSITGFQQTMEHIGFLLNRIQRFISNILKRTGLEGNTHWFHCSFMVGRFGVRYRIRIERNMDLTCKTYRNQSG